MAHWNPTTYLEFADERSRPFYDLVSRVGAPNPGVVVDLGCGPGQLTASLADRWPEADIRGVDSSATMIDRAAQHHSDRVAFAVGDVRTWSPDRGVDVLISNAALQWVPRHRDLFRGWLDWLTPDGWFAFQVPGNFEEPSHQLLQDLAADSRFARYTDSVERPTSVDAATYLGELSSLGCTVDAWETTYLHVLSGPDPVYRWISGTGARPVLQALPDGLRATFVAEYQALLRSAYPVTAVGTVLPFRRIFVVAQRGGDGVG